MIYKENPNTPDGTPFIILEEDKKEIPQREWEDYLEIRDKMRFFEKNAHLERPYATEIQ